MTFKAEALRWLKDLRLFLLHIPKHRVEATAWKWIVGIWFICLTTLLIILIRG